MLFFWEGGGGHGVDLCVVCCLGCGGDTGGFGVGRTGRPPDQEWHRSTPSRRTNALTQHSVPGEPPSSIDTQHGNGLHQLYTHTFIVQNNGSMKPAPPCAMLVTSAPCVMGVGATLSTPRPVGPSPPSVSVPVRFLFIFGLGFRGVDGTVVLCRRSPCLVC